MKSMTKKSFASVLVIIALGFASCAKPDIEGCMDKDSTNYDATATVDDGNCLYSASLLIWWSSATKDAAQLMNCSSAKIYVDGVFEGAVAISIQSFDAAPACGTSGALTSTFDLGTNKTKAITVRIDYVDTQDILITSDSKTGLLYANTCNKLEI